MCAKISEPADKEEDVFVENEYDELSSSIPDVDSDGQVDGQADDNPVAENNVSEKLAAKKRMDDYLERKWFKDQGWDDDDELFGDEYFAEDNS